MDLLENAGLNDQQDYVIDRIGSTGLKDEEEVRYKVRWFGYKPKNGTWLPRSAIPDNFIARYWSKTCHT